MSLSTLAETNARVAEKAIVTLADPRLIAGRQALEAADPANAQRLLDELLAEDPDNPVVLNLRAEVDLRQLRYGDASVWFERCLSATPGHLSALHGLAYCQFHRARLAEARTLVDRMLTFDPVNIPARLLKAATAALAGDNADAALIYTGILAERPGHYPSLLGLGHSLRIIGRADEAIGAYKEARRVSPGSCEPWSCLASLKTYRFSDEELNIMLRLDGRRDLPEAERIHLSFALGRAFWERGLDEASFSHYARGNALCREQAGEDPEEFALRVDRWIDDSISAFAAPAESHAHPQGAPVPIFVVGLPRSGTTLVEQILGAHSAVEAAGELPHLATIARRLMDETTNLAAVDRAALGAAYLESIAAHRKTNKTFIIDKLPTNFRNVALIRAILPQARIVDVRRHPLASCVAMLRQNFLNLPEYAGTMADLARSRKRYVEAMDRFDTALPGAVTRIRYEDLVRDTETQIRHLIAALDLPFEDACLAWHRSGQPVRTPSSEQVRQPIYRDALEEWRRLDLWLEDAKVLLAAEVQEWKD
ncbi:tetratricopeptide repeat-containing sulfotransferase family protein [Sphingomonas oligophenolica]